MYRGDERAALIESIRQRMREREKNRGKPPSCPPGEIPVHRRGYTRSDGTRVRPTNYCMKDRGAEGKTKDPPFKIKRKGDLGGPGYLSKPAKERHKLLDKSVKKYGYRSTLGKIHALEVMGKRTLSKDKLKKLAQDRRYLVKKYGGSWDRYPGEVKKNPADDEALVRELIRLVGL